jgi:nitrogen fixation NifU-like protein
MPDLKDLYQDIILDHYKRPRNFRELDDSNREAQGLNPLCGDKLSIFLRIADGILLDISFVGMGCAISIASASMMTEILKGKTESDIKSIYKHFHNIVANAAIVAPETHGMGDLAVFSTLREYPVRVKCATLAWNTMLAALEGREGVASTE